MQIEVIALGKNFYEMDNNKGANLVIYGQYEDTNNKTGISVSEAPIDFEIHEDLTVFPAKYFASAELISMKNRGGKTVTALKLSNLEFVEKVKFVGAE